MTDTPRTDDALETMKRVMEGPTRLCHCADPENCTQRIPGYRCRADTLRDRNTAGYAEGFRAARDAARKIVVDQTDGDSKFDSAIARMADDIERLAPPSRTDTCKHGTPRTMYDVGPTSADCSKCAAEAFGHQSCTQDPIYRYSVFGWWCVEVALFVDDPEDAEKIRAKGLTLTPLYTRQECVHQVGRNATVAANLRAFADRYDPKDTEGRHTDRGMAKVLREAASLLDSQSVAGKKPFVVCEGCARLECWDKRECHAIGKKP